MWLRITLFYLSLLIMNFLVKFNQSSNKKRAFMRVVKQHYGVNDSRSKALRYMLGCNKQTRINQLGIHVRYNISSLFSKEKYCVYGPKKDVFLELLFDGRLKAKECRDINKLISNHSYRGLRHNYNLPVHGQRTHSHGNTQFYLGKKRKILRLNLRRIFFRGITKKKLKLSKKEQEVIFLKKKIDRRRLRRLRKRRRFKLRRRYGGVLAKN